MLLLLIWWVVAAAQQTTLALLEDCHERLKPVLWYDVKLPPFGCPVMPTLLGARPSVQEAKMVLTPRAGEHVRGEESGFSQLPLVVDLNPIAVVDVPVRVAGTLCPWLRPRT